MPSIAFGFKVSSSGERLPFTTVTVGSRTLRFNGRPGPSLIGAVERLEAEEAEAERRLSLPQVDPRD